MPVKGLGTKPPKMLQVMTSACWSTVPLQKRVPDAHIKPKPWEVLLEGDLFAGRVQAHPTDQGG